MMHTIPMAIISFAADMKILNKYIYIYKGILGSMGIIFLVWSASMIIYQKVIRKIDFLFNFPMYSSQHRRLTQYQSAESNLWLDKWVCVHIFVRMKNTNKFFFTLLYYFYLMRNFLEYFPSFTRLMWRTLRTLLRFKFVI